MFLACGCGLGYAFLLGGVIVCVGVYFVNTGLLLVLFPVCCCGFWVFSVICLFVLFDVVIAGVVSYCCVVSGCCLRFVLAILGCCLRFRYCLLRVVFGFISCDLDRWLVCFM